MNFHGTDANRAIVVYFGAHSASLPEHTRNKLTEALVSPDALGAIITTFEALYAARADLEQAGIELLEGLARFVGQHNFYGKGMRAAMIAGVAARIAGGGAPEAEGDPEIEEGFAAPEVVEAPAGVRAPATEDGSGGADALPAAVTGED